VIGRDPLYLIEEENSEIISKYNKLTIFEFFRAKMTPDYGKERNELPVTKKSAPRRTDLRAPAGIPAHPALW
jgi:hypothetical protein